MNIFVTNTNPSMCAADHCSIHRNKMIVEYAQLLSTAQREKGNKDDTLYKSTHKNHPSAVWVRESKGNYQYVYKLWLALNYMYTLHTGKDHKSFRLVHALKEEDTNEPPKFTKDMLAMPDEYKGDNICKSYQDYLCSKFKEWRSRDKPLKVQFLKTPYWYSE